MSSMKISPILKVRVTQSGLVARCSHFLSGVANIQRMPPCQARLPTEQFHYNICTADQRIRKRWVRAKEPRSPSNVYDSTMSKSLGFLLFGAHLSVPVNASPSQAGMTSSK
mmetsp:Transcript_3646/g.13078  ORF Transcript_3646/g.13078 Transcript_3646/m.13078 type:complete len:111 (-) Transcript_3646:1168-1500(-)